MIAFDKPAGLLTAPDRWDKSRPNLMAWVHEKMSREWFNAHRLDAGASGVVLCAKTKHVLGQLCRMFEQRTIRKTYWAITRGVPSEPSGLIRWRLAPDPRRPGRMRVHPRGKEAATHYAVEESWGGFALIRCEPLTGRQHQLRAHLGALGCPVVGDVLYGGGRGLFLSELKRGFKRKAEPERPLIGRLALHAAALDFEHPLTGAHVRIEAPLPRDFEVALKYLRRFGSRVRSGCERGPDFLRS